MIRVRYDGSCAVCGRLVVATSQSWWDPTKKTLTCPSCRSSDGPDPLISSDALEQPVAIGDPIPSGVAGGSAQREFDRRHEAREREIRERHPRIGGFLLKVSDEKKSTSVWAKGAEGERRVGARLDDLRLSGVVTLHDRRVPGKRSNLDHIAVSPSGVWVIDAKHYKGEISQRDVGGLFRRELRLHVRGRDQTKLVSAVLGQVAIVQDVIGRDHPDVPIRPVLCFVDGDWPLFAKPFEVQGVLVCWPKALAKSVGRSGPIGPEVVDHIAALLADRLAPA